VELSFPKKVREGLKAGICFYPDGISVAVVLQRSGKPLLERIAFKACSGPDAYRDTFSSLANELKLKGVPAVFVLEPGSYSLLQVESPAVEAEELLSAVRWRIKDLIDVHVDDVSIDVFDLPKPKRAGATPMLSVVTVKNTLVQERVDLLDDAGLEIEAIDITELALRNLAVLTEEPNRAQAFLYLSPRYGLIEITGNSLLYLSRNIETTARDLEQIAATGGEGAGDALYSSLVLEVQRSMDYYESQFGEGAVSRLMMLPVGAAATRSLTRYAEENLTVPVGLYDLSEWVDGVDAVSPEEILRCLPALGGALRV
jgi:MSHA biogenesis protein MshI